MTFLDITKSKFPDISRTPFLVFNLEYSFKAIYFDWVV